MALIRPSEPWAQTAEQAARRNGGFAARSELALREALEAFCRERWPEARVVHEIVMGAGKVRADVAAIGARHIAAFEVKGAYDDTTRLLHQVGMFQLCVPEVWMVVAERHVDDARLIRHLLPSIGLLKGRNIQEHYDYRVEPDQPVTLELMAKPRPRKVVPKMMLELLWADELRLACDLLQVSYSNRSARPTMIKALIEHCRVDELQAAVCAALRGRDALWRADEPIRPTKLGAS